MATDDERQNARHDEEGPGEPHHQEGPGHRPADPQWSDSPPDAEAITRLLTALADDPDAPPSAVTAESVLAAARAERPARGGLTAVPGEGRTTGSRRRTGFVALLAAAAVAGLAAIVIPVALNGSGSTNTASDSASEFTVGGPDSGASQSSPADRSAAGNAAAAAAPEQGSAASAAAGSATAEPPGASAPAAAAPAQTLNENSETADGGSAPGGSAGGGSAADAAGHCWPPLSPAAAAALIAALPPGSFGAPAPLDGGCEDGAVAGAVLAGSEPGAELVVRVVDAEPGSCLRTAGQAGPRCVASADPASGGDRYTATDPSGATTVFVYGDGRQVSVGSTPSVGGIVPAPTGLTADQLDAAARAVLAVL